MATNPIDKEGLELARTINAKLVAIRADIAALELAMESVGGGAGTWEELDGKPSTFPPTAHKSSHATGGSDALTPSDIGAQPAGSYAPASGISPSAITGTAVTLSGAQTIAAKKTFSGDVNELEDYGLEFLNGAVAQFQNGSVGIFHTGSVASFQTGSVSSFVGTPIFYYSAEASAAHRTALGLGALATVTPGTNVATALAIAANATGGMFRQGQALSATTVTASGSVTVASGGIVTTSNGNLNLSPNGTGYLNVGSRSYFGDGNANNSFQIISGSAANLITTGAASIRTNSNSLVHNAATGGTIYFNRDVSGATTIWNNTSSNILMQLYPSGGLHVGSTPTDPGANNQRIQGTLSVTGASTLTGGLILGELTVGTLPTASSNTRRRYEVTDSLAPSLGATVAPGGSARCTVRSNGTAWIVIQLL